MALHGTTCSVCGVVDSESQDEEGKEGGEDEAAVLAKLQEKATMLPQVTLQYQQKIRVWHARLVPEELCLLLI